MGKIKLSNKKGITIVSVVITVVLLIILAVIAIGIFSGENGIIETAKDTKYTQDVARIQEKLELLKSPIALNQEKVNIETYLRELNNKKEDYKIDTIEREENSNFAYVTVEGEYKFLIEDKENGDVEITYMGVESILTLSEYSGTIIYPGTKTFTVTENESGGALSVSSLDEDVAVATIDNDGKVTVEARGLGETYIIVKSEKNGEYGQNTVKYNVVVKEGNLGIIATGYNGIYDGKPHSISVTAKVTGVTISYSTSKDGTYTNTNPTFTNAGTYVVYYKVEKEEYETVTGTARVEIEKAEGKVLLSETSSETVYGTNKVFTVTENISNGTLVVKSSDKNIAIATIDNNGKVTVVPGTKIGKASVTVKSEATTNYKEASATYEIDVKANENTPYKVVHQKMNLDGTYEIVETEEKTATAMTKVTPEVKTYEGFTSPEKQEVTIAVDGNTVITYKYARNKYTFTLGTATGVNTNGSTESGSYYYGETITLKATANEGYTWNKWLSSNQDLAAGTTKANVSFTMPAGDLILTPKVATNEYTITYDLDGGEVDTENPAGYNVETEDITLNNPTKEGYTFAGWTGSNGETAETEVTIAKGSTGNKTYTANWTINQYKIDLNMKVDGTSYWSGYNSRIYVGLKIGDTDKGYVHDHGGNYDYGTTWEIYGIKLDGVIVPYTDSGTLGAANFSIYPPEFYTVSFASNNSSYGKVSTDELLVIKGTTYKTSGNTLTLSDDREVTATVTDTEGYKTEFSNWSSTSGTINAKTSINANFARTVNSYKVTYNYSQNGGTSATKTTANVNYNSAIDLTVTASKSGYTFVGWNTDKNATTALSSLTMKTSDVTLYAIYSKTITATCNYYKGQTTKVTGTMYNNETEVAVKLPTIANQKVGDITYTQRGWSASDSANATAAVVSGGTVSLSANTTYYASYQANITGTFYYSTLTLNDYTNSGAAQSSATATAVRYMKYNGELKESNYTIPTAVTGSTGGNVAQNYAGVSTTKSSATVVTPTTANTVFYAVYTEPVTLYYYNGTAATSKTITRRMLSNGETYSSSLSEEAPTPSAYDGASFKAWSYNNSNYGSDYIRNPIATGSGVLYAIYQKTITITYDANGGTGAPSASTGTKTYISKDGGFNTYNPSITLNTSKPTRTGYTFAGWYDAKTGGTKVGDAGASYTASANKTIYARWTTNNYTITYDNNLPRNYMIPTSSTITYSNFTGATNTCITIGKLYTEGLKAGDKITVAMDIAYNNVTVDTTQNYFIRPQGSGNVTAWNPGIGCANSNQIVGTGTLNYKYTFTLTESQLSNDYFSLSIRTDYITGGTLTISNMKITKNVTTTATLAYGTALGTLPTVSETGFTFNGWYTALSGGTKISSTTTVPAANTTYYARWTTHTYTIAFNANGGSGTMSNITGIKYDTATALTANAFTRTGYTFTGWNTKADGTGTTYSNKASVSRLTATNGGTVTLYAQWKINTYTLTVNPNGGTYNSVTTNTTISGNYDTGKNVGSATAPSGYKVTFNGNGATAPAAQTSTKTFTGWTKSGTGEYVAGSNAAVSGMTRTVKTESGETYENFTYTASSPTANTWYHLRYPAYTYTDGSTYEIRFKLRINSIANSSIEFRHSALANDYGTPGRVSKTFSAATSGWQDVVLTRTISGTTTTLSETTKTVAPVFEVYTSNLLNKAASANFDIKDVMIINKSTGKLLQSNANLFWFRAGNGTLTANYSNNSITLPSITRAGYKFNGWYTAASGGTRVGGASDAYTPTAATTLYAQWTAIPTGTITINSVGYDSNNKARVKIATTATGYTLQYATSTSGPWTTITSGNYTGYSFAVGTTVYARLCYGTTEANEEYTKLTIPKRTGTLTLSATSGTLTYPTSGTFTVTANSSGGTLSVASNNTAVATATIDSAGKVTVKPGTTAGTATITVTSAANTNYVAKTATYTATVKNGTITLEATAYTGNYDAKAHNAVTITSKSPSDVTLKYSLNGGTYSTTMPTVKDIGTYTISVQASKAGYTTKTISKTASIIISYYSPYIPIGFTHTEGTWNNGYTIKNSSTGDEFVWVPCVTDQSKVRDGDTVVTFQKYLPSSTATTDPYYAYNKDNLTISGDEGLSAYEIRASVKEYGGFYIAKYEAGLSGTTENNSLSTKTATDGSVKPLSQAGKGVWNYITRADAIRVSESMIDEDTTGAVSALISGECWDTTLQWIVNASDNKDKEPNLNYDTDATNKGWDSNIASSKRHVTGYYAINNIYDMAGNVWEWTTENVSSSAITRGGSYYYTGLSRPTAYRQSYDPSSTSTVGFRTVMYKPAENTGIVIKDGELLKSDYIVSNTGTRYSWHATSSITATTDAENKYFGAYCCGYLTGGVHSCSATPYADVTLTLDDSLVGKQCTLVGYYRYSARYYGVSSAYIKNGTETIMSFSGNNTEKTSSKTFTLNSNTIQLYIKFKCDNDTWLPGGHIGIQSLIIE